MKNRKLFQMLGVIFVLVLYLSTTVLLGLPQKAEAASAPSYRSTRIHDTSASGAYSHSMEAETDQDGNLFTIGQWYGTVIFDGPGGSDSKTTANESVYLTKYNANGTYAWTKTFDTSGVSAAAYVFGLASDPSGNIFMNGWFQNTITFDGAGGSDTKTQPWSSFLTKYNANGTYGWTKVFDTTSGTTFGDKITTDSSGNIYTTGEWTGTIVFDGVGGSDSKTTANPNSYITKYNANGSYGWTKVLGQAGGASSRSTDVAVDSHNNIYLIGEWSSTTTFDGPGGTNTIAGSNVASYLIKYNSAGTFQSVKVTDATTGIQRFSSPKSVAIDSSDNIYVTGSWVSTIIFDGMGGSDSRTTAADNASYTTKYNANGTYAWTSVTDGDPGDDIVSSDIDIGPDGGIYVGGWWYQNARLDGPAGTDTRVASNYRTFLTRYNSDGTYDRTLANDDAGDSNNYGQVYSEIGIAFDTLGRVYIVSDMQGTIDFDDAGGSDTKTSTNETASITSYQVLGASTGGDNDPINAIIEDAAPNNGDANGDGSLDSGQDDVTSFVNSVTSKYAVLETSGSTTTNSVSISPESTSHPDTTYDYPNGLINFSLQTSAGQTVTVTEYFYGNYPAGSVIVRSFDPDTNTYTTIPNVTLENKTIGGQAVLSVSYPITDGSALDTDNTANGTIVHSGGPALAKSPKTGIGHIQNNRVIALFLGGFASTCLLLGFLPRRRKQNI